MDVYPFIEAEKTGSGNVHRACALLKISRSAYSAHRAGRRSTRARQDTNLAAHVIAIHDRSRGTTELHEYTSNYGHKVDDTPASASPESSARPAEPVTPKRWRTTTVPDPAATTPPNLIRRDFSCAATDIDTRWCGDITYIHTWEGWLYLAIVIGIASRRVVGWATADYLRTDLVAQALDNAVRQRRP